MIEGYIDTIVNGGVGIMIFYILNKIERKSERIIDLLHQLNGGEKKDEK